MSRRALCLLWAALLAPLHLEAQAGTALALLASADSAFEEGLSDAARAGYEAVLEQDPDQSRAIYQLARLLKPGSPRMLRLLQRYTELEPSDAWGYDALARAWASAGKVDRAVAAFDDALAIEPGERDFLLAKARVLARARRVEEAVRTYHVLLALEPGDVEALGEAAEQHRRAGRLHTASSMLSRSLVVSPDGRTTKRRDLIAAELAPSVAPRLLVIQDSDGNSVWRLGAAVETHVLDGLLAGFRGAHTTGADANGTADAVEGSVLLEWRPRYGLRLKGGFGMARTAGEDLGHAPERIPLLHLQARWRPGDGAAADFQLTREPIMVTPLLLATPVVLQEARGLLDLPIAGPLYLRSRGRIGALDAQADRNTRVALATGPVLRIGDVAEASALYHQTRYAHASQAGYSSPARIEMLDAGVYFGYYDAWPLELVMDLGAGGERITRHDGHVSEWHRALRLWSAASWSLRPGWGLHLEAEAYETRGGAILAPDGAAWRWGSLALSLSTALK